MKRRNFITLLVSTAAAPPLATRAQPTKMPVIGFLNGFSLAEWAKHAVAGFHQGLNETGFVEGRNVAIEYRWAEGQFDRLPALVAELIRRKVDVLVVTGGGGAGLPPRRRPRRFRSSSP